VTGADRGEHNSPADRVLVRLNCAPSRVGSPNL
jgi:hypothetical protein